MSAPFFPVAKSFLAEEALARTIEAEYGLAAVCCQLITASLRDVYRVRSGRQSFVLFVYRYDQRPPAEIVAEWQFVDYLAAHSVPVAPAIRRNSGELLLTFDAPEGRRYGVLTRYVPGKHLRQRPSPEAVRAYGRIVAQLHTVSDVMTEDLDRPANDVGRSLERFMAAFEAEMPDRPRDLALLREAAARVMPGIEALPRAKPLYGMIHGDVIRANAQVADDGAVTILDFDLCGPGWRAYDVASYLAVIRGLPEEKESEQAFLSGYEGVRPLTVEERAALPLFEAVRVIFSVGIPALNVYHWGSAYSFAYLDLELERLRQVMERIG